MSGLAAIVEKPRADDAIASLRREGVYDTSRSAAAHTDDTIALPVLEPPEVTEVLSVVQADLPAREHGLAARLHERGWTDDEVSQAPSSWAVLGTVVLVDIGDSPRPSEIGEALLDLHGESDTVLARHGVSGSRRDPTVEVVAGEGDTETVHTEHGTQYAMDLATVMFSPGNKRERARMGELVETDERVFDMFAGIGYFTLPMARAGAEVIATEIDSMTYRFLVENAVLNDVQASVTAYRADCRDVAEWVAETPVDRIVMGHFDAHEYLDVALPTLTPGGTLHLHEATPEALVPDRPIARLEAAAADVGRAVDVLDCRDVKGYSEGVRHVVVDATVA